MGSFHVALITMLLCMLIVLATVDCQGNKIQLKEVFKIKYLGIESYDNRELRLIRDNIVTNN